MSAIAKLISVAQNKNRNNKNMKKITTKATSQELLKLYSFKMIQVQRSENMTKGSFEKQTIFEKMKFGKDF